MQLLNGDSQVIELQLSLIDDGDEWFRLMVEDGLTLDVLGSGEQLAESVLGPHHEEDPRRFYW
jgi:hypothetical protein